MLGSNGFAFQLTSNDLGAQVGCCKEACGSTVPPTRGRAVSPSSATSAPTAEAKQSTVAHILAPAPITTFRTGDGALCTSVNC